MKTSVVLMIAMLGAVTACAQSGYIEAKKGEVFRPMVSGDWIAWDELKADAVYAKNISTGQEVEVAAPGTAVVLAWAPWHPQIDISGDTVVWMSSTPTVEGLVQQIWSYNLATGQAAPVGPKSPRYGAENFFPAIDGKWVAWQGHSGEEWTVLVHNLENGGEKALGKGDLPLPRISGDRMVWDDRAKRQRLMLTDLTTNQSQSFYKTAEYENPRAPVISGDVIAWCMRDLSSGKNVVKIVAYDTRTGELVTVCGHTGSLEHRANVAVSGNIVLWEDWRNNTGEIDRENLDVYGYDLSTRKEFPVATGPGNQHRPWIDGDLVVWVDDSTGTPRVGWKRLTVATTQGAPTTQEAAATQETAATSQPTAE